MKFQAWPLVVTLLAAVAVMQAVGGSLQGGRPGSGLSWAWYTAWVCLVLSLLATVTGAVGRVLAAVALVGVLVSFALSIWG